jgi:hypothetical protein
MTDIVNSNVTFSPREFVLQCDEFIRYPVATPSELVSLLKCLLEIHSNNHSASYELISLIMGVLVINQSLWASSDNTDSMKRFFYCVLFKIFELDDQVHQLPDADPELIEKIRQVKHICIQDSLLAGLCCHDLIAFYFESSRIQTTELLQLMHKFLTLSTPHPTTLLAFQHNIRNISVQMRHSSKHNYPWWQTILKTYMQKSEHICCMSFVKKSQVLYPCMNPPVTQWCRVHEKRRKKLETKLSRYTYLPLDLIRLVEYYGI